MKRYTSLAVFLLGAVALVLPFGYFIGPALLLLGSLALPMLRPRPRIHRDEWWIIGVLLAYGSVNLLETWWHGSPFSDWDDSGYALLAIPCLLLLLAFPPKAVSLWAGVAVGSLIAGLRAGWETFVMGATRAHGFMDKIQFGDLSLLFGIFCLAGLGWVFSREPRPRRLAWCALLVLGALGGLLGSFLSGSRGGWVSLPFLLVVVYLGFGRHLSRRGVAMLGALLAIGAMTIYAIPQSGVQERIQRIFSSYQEFVDEGDPTNSVGARLEMWRTALILIPRRPWTGWGSAGYEQARDELIANATVHPYLNKFDHVHNDFLDAWLKRGLPGLATLLALYLTPLALFARRLHSRDLQLRAFGVAGVVLPVAYMGFGLTQTFLAFDSGIVTYVLWLAVLWSGLRCRERMPTVTEVRPGSR